MKKLLLIPMTVLGLGLAIISFKSPSQAVKVAPALVLEPQVSFPVPEQGMLVVKTDGNLYYYNFGWKKVKLVPAN